MEDKNFLLVGSGLCLIGSFVNSEKLEYTKSNTMLLACAIFFSSYCIIGAIEKLTETIKKQ